MADIDEIGEERLREVGQYLAHLREMHGLTQKEAATLAGMTASAYLSLLESGKRMISLKTLEKLSAAYGKVTLDEMIEHIGFTKKGKLLTENYKARVAFQAEQQAEPEATPEAKPKSEPKAELKAESKQSLQSEPLPPVSPELDLVDAALQFIGHDREFQMPPFSPQTAREKAMIISLYQQSSGRKLLRDDELERLSQQH